MICLFASRLQNRPRPNRTGLLLSLVSAALLATAAAGAHAQFTAPAAGTQAHDISALHPPAGARVAIVEFADMECPDCGRANPVLKEAAAKYKIPWLRHDFPLPYHAWSTTSAINARWFDSRSKALGDEYRDLVYASQASLFNNLDLLNRLTEKFAKEHGVSLPFAVDPQGKLAAEVNADKELGKRIGIEHTPTIWVVTANSKGAPFIEITDRSKLYQIIDQALVDTAPAAKAAVKSAAKPAVKKATAK